jgi:outer membrane lipopolysaccharide assembly protein LptE/RlpB
MRHGAWIALAIAALTAGCGYHVAGRADLLPKNIKTIAIPAFTNTTTRYRLAERLPAALTREFITRTRYNIVADPNAADAVLSGVVIQYGGNPVVYDQTTGRATTVQVYVRLDITLRDRATGAVLYSRIGMEIRERYEISVDPAAYFEESDMAIERVSRDAARTVVSAILEKF